MIVRVNALDTPHFEGDLMAFACPQVALLNLPKAQSAADVQRAAAALESAERRNGVARPIGLLVNIETARGLRLAHEIAAAHPRVAGLQLGLADLFESMHADRRSPANVHAAMFQMSMACAESGKFAYDSAYPDVADAEGFRREAEQARQLGFVGKSCIHPRQVAVANEVFGAATLDVDTARRIVAAARDAEQSGRGAFLLDGRMIDLPFIKRAQAVLAAANDSDRL
jgi:citrate lyase subunit beta/citryl-CoA lyase